MTWRLAAIRVAAVLCVPVLAALSLLPSDQLVRTGAADGIEHFVAYGGAAFLAALAWAKSRRAGLMIVFAFVVYGGVLEVLQLWSPGRKATLANFLQSAAGAICGGALAIYLGRLAALGADLGRLWISRR